MAKDTKDRIYDAAVELFYRFGYNGTSLRGICAESGAQISSVYYHFENKQELLYAILKRATVDSTELLNSRLEGVVAAPERLAVAIEAHIEWHTSRQREAFIADAEFSRLEAPHREEVLELRRRHERVFSEIIEAGISAGEFADTQASLLTRMLMTGATGVSSWYNAEGAYQPAAIAEFFSAAILSGLRNR
jgi:AcrR family transcriptional regulator